jgi:hypothetical protein
MARLRLTAADAELLAAVTGNGNAVTVTALEVTPGADLGHLWAALLVTAEVVAADPVVLTANLSKVDTLSVSGGSLVTVGAAAVLFDGVTTVELADTASLSLSAADAALLAAVNGTGNAVTVTALELAVEADLSNLSAALVVTAELVAEESVTLTANLSTVDTLNISGEDHIYFHPDMVLADGVTTVALSGTARLGLEAVDAELLVAVTGTASNRVRVDSSVPLTVRAR